jgi:hypothetical protein
MEARPVFEFDECFGRNAIGLDLRVRLNFYVVGTERIFVA